MLMLPLMIMKVHSILHCVKRNLPLSYSLPMWPWCTKSRLHPQLFEQLLEILEFLEAVTGFRVAGEGFFRARRCSTSSEAGPLLRRNSCG